MTIPFEVTFDSPSLDVGAEIFDITDGITATPVGSVTAMVNASGTNTYFGQFSADADKRYLIVKSVFTDNTLATKDTNYNAGSDTVAALS